MNPDKLRAWLNRNRESRNAHSLQLSQETVEGAAVFQSWPLSTWPGGEVPVQEVLDACGDHADACEEQIRVRVEIVDSEGTVVAFTIHKASPQDPVSEDAATAGSVSSNAVVSQLLRALEMRERLSVGTQTAQTRAFGHMMDLQQKMIDRLAIQNAALTLELRAARTGEDVPSAEELETEAQRANAWAKVAELAPAVLSMVVQHLGPGPGGRAADTGSETAAAAE